MKLWFLAITLLLIGGYAGAGPDNPGHEQASETKDRMAPTTHREVADFSPPVLIESTMPEYPIELIRQGRTGQVVIECIVDTQGAVRIPMIVESSHEAFAESTLNAVRNWKFTPAAIDGKPVPQLVRIPVNFKLNPMEPKHSIAWMF